VLSAVGVVPLDGRGDLPLADLHGEPMFVHPVRALRAAGVRRVVVTTTEDLDTRVRLAVAGARLDVELADGSTWWAAAPAQQRLVLVDPLCPLIPAEFVRRLLLDDSGDTAVAGYRPVTDTVKTVVDARVAGTIDRESLAVVVSPVVLPARLPDDEPPPTPDFALLVTWLRGRGPVRLVEAPAIARRVADLSALRVLESVDDLGGFRSHA
jgi:2-C-methyl-D-erythritol 4-phosphate cytidylyltransferase